jgi:putative CocE/NonD family hydrolase
MGLTSMAAAGSSEGHNVSAVVPVLASSRLHPILNPGGSVSLELGLRWLYIVLGVDADVGDAYFSNVMRVWRIMVSAPILDRALLHVPIADCDSAVCAQKIEFYQEAIRNTSGQDEFWQNKDILLDLTVRPPPLLLFAAWFDFFLTQQLEDYRMAALSQPLTRLIIAPTSHWSIRNDTLSIPAALDFFETTLKDGKPADGLPVRVSVMQANGEHNWASFASWPPSGTTERRLFLQPKGRFGPNQAQEGKRSYTFDAADPTPAVGGAGFHVRNSGQMDQTAFEKRADILVYTSEPLGEVAIIGTVKLEVYMRSSLCFYDVVGRLCVVSGGRSLNLCDGMTRVTATTKGDITKVEVVVGACALRLRAGERLRLHVCSGAHPRFMRNYGTGEPIAEATTLLKAHQEVLHGPTYPSSLTISLLPLSALSLTPHFFNSPLSTLPSQL